MWNIKAEFESMTLKDGKWFIEFSTDDVSDKPEKLSGHVLSIDIKKYSPPKSNSANSYYWVLCTKISEELSKETYTSIARVHNLHLRSMWNELVRYRDGVPQFDILPNTDKAEQETLEDADLHLMPSPESLTPNPIFTNSSGKEFRYYITLNGVKTMNSKQISHLIDICIQECQDLGIETKTPDEIARLDGYEKQSSIRT